MRFRSTLAIAFALAVPATGVAAQAFEGVVTQKMSAGGMNAEMTVYVKGDKFRQDMSGMGMPGSAVVVDGSKNEIFMLMSEQKMYMRVPAPPPRQGEGAAVQFTATGRKETIAGHECEHYTVKADNTDVDVCVATGLGVFYGTGGGNPMGGRRGGGGGGDGMSNAAMRELARQFKDGFFPLKIQSQTDRGPVSIEVTKIEKKAVSDDMFVIPEGFTEMRMGGRGGN
jgi:hypothetical protein